MKDYTTDCLYIASALMIETESKPSKIIKAHSSFNGKSRAYIQFDNVDSELIRKLEGHEMLVDPLKLRDVHIALKREVFKVIDSEENKDEHEAAND